MTEAELRAKVVVTLDKASAAQAGQESARIFAQASDTFRKNNPHLFAGEKFGATTSPRYEAMQDLSRRAITKGSKAQIDMAAAIAQGDAKINAMMGKMGMKSAQMGALNYLNAKASISKVISTFEASQAKLNAPTNWKMAGMGALAGMFSPFVGARLLNQSGLGKLFGGGAGGGKGGGWIARRQRNGFWRVLHRNSGVQARH